MFEKSKYDMEYAKAHIKRKHIPFNMNNPEDVALFDWLNSRPNVTQYIKGLIAADMGNADAMKSKR